MKLSDIMAISAMPGLYKFVAQGRGAGIIVEPLDGGRRTMISNSAKVSSLGEIAMFTVSSEIALGEVLQKVYDKNSGKQLELSSKSSSEELNSFIEDVLPDYDRDQVHTSDIRKLVTWYNLLIGAGMTSFIDEPEEEEGAPSSDSLKEIKKTSPTVSQKQVVSGVKSKASAPSKKVTSLKGTTNRKSQ